MPTDIHLQAVDLALAAKRWGDGRGEPVLALHGWLDNCASFDFLAPLLPDYDVVALDLPGHGHSAHLPDSCQYNFLDYVKFIIAAADDLGWEQFHLLGHSLGGALASVVASAFPERVKSATFIDSIGPVTETVALASARLSKAVNKVLHRSNKAKKCYPDIELAIKNRQRSGGLNYESAKVLVERGIKAVDGGYQWRFDDKLLLPSNTYMTEEQVHAILRDIVVPVLLIQASDGILHDNIHVQHRMTLIDNLSHVIVEGHHHVHMEAPQSLAIELTQFIQF
ncbi:MAG: alpha/beta hydrolase [Legionellales bacterium]|nr:alpha/beta hydrolase [Legionellales bacterium]|tara:strand:- start:6044 stop:6886 length:843 start_codon:yes stop_codon:yes gene_type:complete